jgi:phenylacetate-CoA ligase
MVFLNKNLKKYYYSNCIKRLQAQDSSVLEKISQQKVLQKVQRNKDNRFYRSLLIKSGAPDNIETIDHFKKFVPILNKDILFGPNSKGLEEILKQISRRETQSILLSSGTSGRFSFGIASSKEISKNALFLDILFHHYFQTLDIKTLVINCLPGAVKLPTLTATILEIGPRQDSLIFALKNLSPQFGQTIILGDNYFLKNAIEESIGEIKTSDLNIHLILGGIYLPENLRIYLEGLLKTDWSKNKSTIYSSMGISEFGLNLFFESKTTIQLRQLLVKNSSLKEKICGKDFSFLPMLFNYFPQFHYLEEINHEIVITDLTDNLVPLIRYNTQDYGKIVSSSDSKSIIKENLSSDLKPLIDSDLVLIFGRDSGINSHNRLIFPQEILDILFSRPSIASQITGYIRLGKENDQISLEIQLKQSGQEDIKHEIEKMLSEKLGFQIRLIIYSYEAFPYGRDIDWERKFKFV